MAARGHRRLLEVGTSAPDFSLERLAGGTATLTEILTGGPALLAFFKITCPVCQLTFPFLERIHGSGGLRIFGISQSDAEGTTEFNQEFGVTLPMLLDAEDSGFPASNDYGISSVPTMFLVEPSGEIAQVMEGWSKRAMETLASRAGVSLWRPGDYVPEWKAG